MKAHFLVAGVVLAGAIAMPALSQTATRDAGKAATRDAGKAATVNGKAIPKSRVDFLMKQQAAQGAPDNEQMRQAIDTGLGNRLAVDRDGLARVARGGLGQCRRCDGAGENHAGDEEIRFHYCSFRAAGVRIIAHPARAHGWRARGLRRA